MTDTKVESTDLVFAVPAGFKTPTKANDEDAGYDLFTPVEIQLEPHKRQTVKIGIRVAIPRGYYGRIAPRSGHAHKQGADVLAGVIDAGYRDEIGVILYNTDSAKTAEFKAGDAIAQLVVEKIYEPRAKIVTDPSQLPKVGTRGEAGFGSTGN